MNLEDLRQKALENLGQVNNLAGLESWRVQFLGRKSELVIALRQLAQMPLEDRRKFGSAGNALRKELEEQYQVKREGFSTATLLVAPLDVTRPGKKYLYGHLHPLTQVIRRATAIFGGMGFAVAEGPEIETERNNFDALNIPSWHPARDLMDTFWLKASRISPEYNSRISPELYSRGIRENKIRNELEKWLLRTHTSPVQIRYMEAHNPPFRIIAPGRVYRHEATDARHEMQFHQIEGLMVGSDVSLANLKAVVETFITSFFGSDAELRMRPGYFPFVEPGVEFDLSCIGCSSRISPEYNSRIKLESNSRRIREKCKLCGGSGWLEFAGAGMVHPNVFRAVGYDPLKVQGFAFGMGVERLAMIKYKIDDVRLFHSGDLRFIKQF